MTVPAAPFYRLLPGHGGSDFCVDRVEVGTHQIAGFDEDDDWGRLPNRTDVAEVLSREAALAVLRLHGVVEFQDWTAPDSRGWDGPLTLLAETK